MRFVGVLLALGLMLGCSAPPASKSGEVPASFDDAPLQRVLETYVDGAGKVNYAALKRNRGDLDRMIQEIESASPENAPQLFPDSNARLAYWINAYNAWVLREVVDHYPIESITKIGMVPFSAFFVERVMLGGKRMMLRSLENDIIRARFHDPRIHFAINCASQSCPPLAPHVYRADTLDQQLDEAARAFINDNRNVTLDEAGRKIVLSKIFDWYESDFTDYLAARGQKDATILDYLKLYSTPERRRILEKLPGAKVSFYDYDWGLNEQARGSSAGGGS